MGPWSGHRCSGIWWVRGSEGDQPNPILLWICRCLAVLRGEVRRCYQDAIVVQLKHCSNNTRSVKVTVRSPTLRILLWEYETQKEKERNNDRGKRGHPSFIAEIIREGARREDRSQNGILSGGESRAHKLQHAVFLLASKHDPAKTRNWTTPLTPLKRTEAFFTLKCSRKCIHQGDRISA